MSIEMNVNNTSLTKATSLDGSDKKEAVKVTPEAKASDTPNTQTVVLTDRAVQLEKLIAATKDLPEINQDKINHFKALIAEGNYDIDSASTAKKILQLEK